MLFANACSIDCVMDVLGADKAPCHLLVELDGHLTETTVRENCDRSSVISVLKTLRFTPGRFGRSARWTADGNGQLLVTSGAYSGAFENFCPDTHLAQLDCLARCVIIPRKRSTWLILSWKHTLCDARGGEELLKIAAGEESSAIVGEQPTLNRTTKRGQSIKQYFAKRRKLSSAVKPTKLHRFFISQKRNDLWSSHANQFFRSAVIIAAGVKALESKQSLLVAVPVAKGRKRIIPGNQLEVLHLFLPSNLNLTQSYEVIVREMEGVVRNGLPDQSNRFLTRISRGGRSILGWALRYPGKNRFADLCVSALGISNISSQLGGYSVTNVRHYPPMLNWGGTTLVYYEHGDVCTMVYLGEDRKVLDQVAQLISGYDGKD